MSDEKKNRSVEWLDPAQTAADRLTMVINEDVQTKEREDVSVSQSEDEVLISPEEARSEERVIAVSPDREQLRILFFTKDTSVLQEESPTYKRITDLRHKFAEVHIILLTHKSPNEPAVVTRLFNTVWLYRTESTSWWKLSFDAYACAEEQLVFSGGFRADIIVAEDPFESGVAAYRIAKRFKRPLQIHVYEDFFDDAYVQTYEAPMMYTWASAFVLRNADSVRTKTEFQREEVLALGKKNETQVAVLPSYYNLSAWRNFTQTFDLHERYPQFKFIMLHVSTMHTSSHSEDVLLGVSPVLRKYPTVGLVVVGNGPLRSHLERQAIALGLQNKIIFEPMPSEILSHLKTANVLVHLSEDGSEDDILLGAASVETPIVGVQAGIAGKLFESGVSARLCPVGDISCVTESVNRYLNDNHTRTQFALRAHEAVMERVEQDYSGYIESYASTIERSLTDVGSN